MELWERRAAGYINKVRALVRDEQNRLYREVERSPGRDHREAELEEIGDLLEQAKDHIDTHGELPWQYSTPLPF